MTDTMCGFGAAVLVSGGPLGAIARGAEPNAWFRAIEAGDLGAVRKLLAARPAWLNERDVSGRTGFATAYLARHLEIGVFLRQQGYQPDVHEMALALDWVGFDTEAAKSPDQVNRMHPVGGSAIFAAAIGGAGSDIWRVYSQGGDPNARRPDAGGKSPLRAALEFPDLAQAEMTAATLLANGAAPNSREADGSSPLHAAASRGSCALIEMLIRKHADVTARDARGSTPLDAAERNEHAQAAALLRGHEAIPRDRSTSRRAYDAHGRPYLAPDLSAFSTLAQGNLVGAAHSNLDRVREMVREHPELVHAVSTTTEGAIEAGAHTGRLPIVDFLLEHGAAYALPTAIVRNDRERVQTLLAEDPLRIHERGPHDFAMLWYPAIGTGGVSMAELLLSAGAEIERQHYLGTTALHFAVRGGDVELAAFLIERGADVNRAGRKFGAQAETPLAIARAQKDQRMAGLLIDKGARS